jgi:hypothetical protein
MTAERATVRKVSLCTTVMDRLHHACQTLPKNIEWNLGDVPVEFVVLDYSSKDGLGAWVRREFQRYIESGVLVFGQIFGRNEFCMAHAKNVAHRLASGDILCNVDADNFTGPGFAAYLEAEFRRADNMFVRSASPRGSSGRLALRSDHFVALGGYDERLSYGWGYEDGDLYERAKAWGLREVLIPKDSPYLSVIRHGIEESTRYYREKNRRISQAKHRALSRESLQRGELVANTGHNWGAGTVLRNFSDWLELAEVSTRRFTAVLPDGG